MKTPYLLLFTLLLSCNNDVYILNQIVLEDEKIYTINDTIENISFEKIVNGDFTLKVNQKLVKKGMLENSYIVGRWDYLTYSEKGKKVTSIVWNRITKGDYSISHSENWEILNNPNSTYLLTLDLKPKVNNYNGADFLKKYKFQ